MKVFETNGARWVHSSRTIPICGPPDGPGSTRVGQYSLPVIKVLRNIAKPEVVGLYRLVSGEPVIICDYAVVTRRGR